MTSRSRLTVATAGMIAALAATLGISVTGTNASAGDADRVQLRSCSLTLEQARSFGPGYVFNVDVKGTSCRKGKKVVRGFHKCRKENGGKRGRCKSKVQGFKCSEKRFDQIKRVSFKSNMTCKRGGASVKSQYSENL